MTWTIEYRTDLPNRRFELMEDTAHRGLFKHPDQALDEARKFVSDEQIKYINWPDDR